MKPLTTISAGLSIVMRLLDGPEEEVTPDVRRHALSSFTHVIRRHTLTEDLNGVEHTANVIFLRLGDLDRSVRLSAGGQHLEPVFDLLHRHLDTEKLPMKETLLISVGLMGKTSNAEILGHVLYLLIVQIAKQNPVIKGSAYTQVLALAKHHNRSAYSLLHPHLEKIAPFLVSRICTQPGLLVECCLLMALNPAAFIERTLPFTLPQLYGNCEAKVLQKIAKDLGVQLSALFLENSAMILAHIFRLQAPGQTNKALAFVVKSIIDETGKEGAAISPQHIVLSCIVSLIAELVIGMGDEANKAAVSVAALRKVERCLAPPSSKNKPDLGAFLKTYMLGVMTNITDMLQELQGKKTVSTKCIILRSLGAFVSHIGAPISNIAPQIMATFQTNVGVPELSEATLESWHTFLTTLGPTEIGPHIGPTTAVFLSCWPVLSTSARASVIKSLEYILIDAGRQLGKDLDDVVDMSSIPELRHLQERLNGLRTSSTPRDHLQRILERVTSDNLTVAHLSLVELKSYMLAEQKGFIHALASGDMFDPMVGQILGALISAACRDSDGTEALKLLAFECIGVLGAVDPDRCEININDPRMIVLSNFADEGEAVLFVLHLIQDVLVGAFRSTSDIKYQGQLAYTIQELLKFCQFTPSVVDDSNSVPLKVRKRWKSLPKQVLSTVTPLLEGRFNLGTISTLDIQHPIYPTQATYREWIQLWTSHLITKAAGPRAQNIFRIFRLVVRSRDVVVAHHLLPHLVLNILISGNDDDKQTIREELLAVLEDQVNSDSDSTPDKKLLSAQAVFMLLDHLNRWVRVVRQDVSTKKAESKRSRANQIYSQAEEQLLRVDSILSNIDQNLMAKAALQCKAYARALMNFERQILTLQERSPHNKDLPNYYERLHEIYSHLDEPDGMEGVSTLILSPSLEHQIRQHESIGRWTSAQSCWEVRLQQSPNNVDFHLGLLRCLRNLGHFDTLRTHVSGVLLRNPGWEPNLVGFEVESAWMVGAWDDVQRIVNRTKSQTSHIVVARLLLAMRANNNSAIAEELSIARSILGAPITAGGVKGYRRSYEAVLDLHLTHELEVIHNAITSLPPSSQSNSQQRRRQALTELSYTLSARFNATLPTFRTREPLLSMRRTAFSLSEVPRPALKGELGRSWLASAKIARKAGQKQTAYSAMLQAQQNEARFSFMESAKLIKTAEPLRAVQELENSMRLLGLIDDNPMVLDLTEDDEETTKMKAKAQVLRARWMNESDRYEVNAILKSFQMATELQPTWESCHYHLGQFHDECFKSLPRADQATRGMRMNLYTVRSFAKAIKFGSKYVYQTVPRLLTIWLDLGEERTVGGTDVFKKLNDVVSRAIKEAPTYKWFTAFPQIVSRVGHNNLEVYKHLSRLIVKVMEEYPKQALWLFTSVVKSTKSNREQRGRQILDQLRNHPNNAHNQVPMLINQCVAMTNELLALCDYPIDDDSSKTLTMAKHFPKLAALGRSPLIIPLQESLTVSLPPTSSSESIHQPFPINAPTFEEFFDEIDIMRSLAKPRKITIRGSNGQIYMFLGKPKDDLRKDARLMDFNAIINKLLKANSESRRRQLRIRTYGVVTLNEECGFIQWVPNTIPIRPVLIKAYESMKIRSWSSEMNDTFKRIKDAKDKESGEMFVEKILPMFPPIFHDWFVETFPEPTAWLASRLSYCRTAAVMSMVGFILGLGDRHCENILLDNNTGDVVHVDFNCLFEKGKTLETPERVPFRLTQNMIDGLGITGVEGVFRIACEVTMQLLRDNKDSLMSVLDAFIHDPLVEWEDEKRKLVRIHLLSLRSNKANLVKPSVDLRMLAKNALNPIEKKLKGVYSTSKERHEKEISTSNLVQMLIQEATDPANLGKMYPGWAAWY
ncbi:hypothetical protein BDZ94DRAFT_1283268 [Collybia nuda]|uniref:non-specific serine/threonine protein kinase n=1 Tax=Collybia nuda TaxID=64659 RepID=A0A9P5Y3M2_9AGAR|nr:hypothetical protein BDZ94DRAFT_1283268 [Collybia nuda]